MKCETDAQRRLIMGKKTTNKNMVKKTCIYIKEL